MKTIQQTYNSGHFQTEAEAKSNVIHRFFDWCEKQEKDRLLWLGFMVAGHGCIFTPITLFMIMLSGNNPVLWPFAIAAITMTLVSNLAAMPTRITIPLFFLSLVIDVMIIVNCISVGLAIPPTA
jgi:hypothetical protein